MSQTIPKSRLAAFFMLCLMVFSIFGGSFQNVGMYWGTPVYAAEGDAVGDLWNTVGNDGSVGTNLDDAQTDMSTLVDKSKEIAKTVTAILSVVCFVALLVCIARLALSAGNPQKRSQALTGIFISGVALALFGGAFIVVSFFWNLLR